MNAVLLELGSIAGSASRDDYSMMQLVVFLDIVAYLQQINHCPVEIQLYAQGPQFDDVDQAFLKELEIKAVNCPAVVHFITPVPSFSRPA